LSIDVEGTSLDVCTVVAAAVTGFSSSPAGNI
jgi:hypothetical protein